MHYIDKSIGQAEKRLLLSGKSSQFGSEKKEIKEVSDELQELQGLVELQDLSVQEDKDLDAETNSKEPEAPVPVKLEQV